MSFQSGSAFANGVKLDSIPAGPGFMRAQDKSLEDKLFNTSSGNLVKIRESGNKIKSGRASCEQIQ